MNSSSSGSAPVSLQVLNKWFSLPISSRREAISGGAPTLNPTQKKIDQKNKN